MHITLEKQESFHTLTENLQHIWKTLTDDEDICYESDDRKFYAVIKRKYGIGRDEINYIRSLPY